MRLTLKWGLKLRLESSLDPQQADTSALAEAKPRFPLRLRKKYFRSYGLFKSHFFPNQASLAMTIAVGCSNNFYDYSE